MSNGSDLRARRGGSARVLAGSLIVVALIMGAVIGVGLDRSVILPHQMRDHRGRGRPGMPRPTADDRRRMLDRLSADLKLTPDQTHKIDSIMTSQTTAFAALRNEMTPRFDALVKETHAKIDSVLTPDQRAIHDKTPPPRPWRVVASAWDRVTGRAAVAGRHRQRSRHSDTAADTTPTRLSGASEAQLVVRDVRCRHHAPSARCEPPSSVTSE